MESLLRRWDGEEMIIRLDRPTGAWILIGVHSTRLGPATGGTRMKSYPDLAAALQDVMNLAAGMTYKFAVAGLPYGGGKAVIAVSAQPDPASRIDLLRRYGTLIHQLGGLFRTGTDVGTTSADMDIIAETGAPYVACRSPGKGGAGESGPATALGVFHAISTICRWLDGDASVAGRRVLVQGAGSTGGTLIDLLREAGAEVLFSDVDQDIIRRFRDELGLEFIPAEKVYQTPCHIFSPCALGGVLNRETIPRLKCRAIAGAANNQLASPEDAERLNQGKIVYAPDYVINSGGALAISGLEDLGWSQAEVDRRVASVGQTLLQVLEVAAAGGITTEAAARRLAEERLASAR